MSANVQYRGIINEGNGVPSYVSMNMGFNRQDDYSQACISELEMSNVLNMGIDVSFNHLTVIAGLAVKYDILWMLYQLKLAAEQIRHNIVGCTETCNRLMSDFQSMYKDFRLDSDLHSEHVYSISYKFSYKEHLDSSITIKRSYFSEPKCYAQINGKILNDLTADELSKLGAEVAPEFIAYENIHGLHCNMNKDELYDSIGSILDYKKRTKDDRIYTLINDMIMALSILYKAPKPCVDDFDIYGLRDRLRDYDRNTLNPNELALIRFLEAILLGTINMANGNGSTVLISSMDSLQEDLRDIVQRILYTFISFNGKAVVVSRDVDSLGGKRRNWQINSLFNSVALHSYSYEVEVQKALNRYKPVINQAYRLNGDKVSLYLINIIRFTSPEIVRIDNIYLPVDYYKDLEDLVELDRFHAKFGL